MRSAPLMSAYEFKEAILSSVLQLHQEVIFRRWSRRPPRRELPHHDSGAMYVALDAVFLCTLSARASLRMRPYETPGLTSGL